MRNCRITSNNVGLFTLCFTPDCDAVVTVTNSILDHNTRVAVDANEHAEDYLVNNTIVANGTGMFVNNSASRVENSIIVRNTGTGICAGSQSPPVQFNDVWGNGVDTSGLNPGQGDLNVDPLLEDEGAVDFRSRVWDAVGNIEAYPSQADACTLMGSVHRVYLPGAFNRSP